MGGGILGLNIPSTITKGLFDVDSHCKNFTTRYVCNPVDQDWHCGDFREGISSHSVTCCSEPFGHRADGVAKSELLIQTLNV